MVVSLRTVIALLLSGSAAAQDAGTEPKDDEAEAHAPPSSSVLDADIPNAFMVVQDPEVWAPANRTGWQLTPTTAWDPTWQPEGPVSEVLLELLVAERQTGTPARLPALYEGGPLLETWEDARSCDVQGGPIEILAALEAERRRAGLMGENRDLDMVACLARRLEGDDVSLTKRQLSKLYELEAMTTPLSAGEERELFEAGLEVLAMPGPYSVARDAKSLMARLPLRSMATTTNDLERLLSATAIWYPYEQRLSWWGLAEALYLGDATVAEAWLQRFEQAIEHSCRVAVPNPCELPWSVRHDLASAKKRVRLIGGNPEVDDLVAMRTALWECARQTGSTHGHSLEGTAVWRQESWDWTGSGDSTFDRCVTPKFEALDAIEAMRSIRYRINVADDPP